MDETLDNMRDSAYFPVASSGKNEDRNRHQCGRFTRGSAEGSFASQRSCHRGKNALSIADTMPNYMLNKVFQTPLPVIVTSGAP